MFPNTTVQLMKGVPFLFNYEHTRWFSNKNDQYSYFTPFVTTTITNNQYKRVHSTSIIVEGNFNDLLVNNYMRFNNNNQKWIYAFIKEVRYVSSQSTEIIYEVDVIQTFMFDFTIKDCFIERQHEYEYKPDGTPFVYRNDEGLDYGTTYKVVKRTSLTNPGDLRWIVIVSSVALDDSPYGNSTLNGFPTNLYYYVIPFQDGASYISMQVNGVTVVSALKILNSFITNEKYAGKLLNIYVSGLIGVNYTVNPTGSSSAPFYNVVSSDLSVIETEIGSITQMYTYTPLFWEYGDKYGGLEKPSSSKLLTYPYTVGVLTDYRGDTFTFKLEDIQSNNLIIDIWPVITQNPKIAYLIRNYNMNGTSIDNGIIDDSTNDIPIITSATATYLQSNRNVINNQNKFAMDSALLSVSANNARADFDMIGLDINQSLSDLSMLEGLGELATSWNNDKGLIAAGTNIGRWALNTAGNQLNRAEISTMNELANRRLWFNAKQVAQANMAKQNDINNMPANIMNQGNNGLFSFLNNLLNCTVEIRQIQSDYSLRLNEYFFRFGYKVDKFQSTRPILNSKMRFNYIKTGSINLTSSTIPQQYLITLEGIFNHGITLWHVDDIYNYNLPNPDRFPLS